MAMLYLKLFPNSTIFDDFYRHNYGLLLIFRSLCGCVCILPHIFQFHPWGFAADFRIAFGDSQH